MARTCDAGRPPSGPAPSYGSSMATARPSPPWTMPAPSLPAPDLALVRQIRLAAGPVRTPSFWQRYAGWLSPAGFVGVGVAGIAAGILVASLSLPLHSAEVLPSVFDHGDADIVFTVNAEDAEQ